MADRPRRRAPARPRRPARGSRRRPSRSALALRWIGALVLVAIAIGYVHPLRNYFDARAEVARRSTEVERLEHANEKLKRRLDLTGTNEFVEREARRLGLVRPGERLFIVTGVQEWHQKQGRNEAPIP
jgi:cell division protein FtsB